MKNIIALTFSTLLSVVSIAQTVPNNSFEQWEDFTFYMEPEQWNTVNQVSYGFGVTPVTQSDDAYDGNYSVRLETSNVFSTINVPGIITLAEFYIDLGAGTYNVSGGIPMHDRVTELDGMYKYSGVDHDSAAILMYNFKNDGSGMDTIGYGYLYLHDTDRWTPFKVNMVYQNNHTPDTLNIAIFSSGNAQELHVGSVLYVDSLVLHTYTGVFNLSVNSIPLNVYPNPARTRITFETLTAGKQREITLYDHRGRTVKNFDFEGLKTKCSIENLSPGIYSYRILEQGRKIASGKFIKE